MQARPSYRKRILSIGRSFFVQFRLFCTGCFTKVQPGFRFLFRHMVCVESEIKEKVWGGYMGRCIFSPVRKGKFGLTGEDGSGCIRLPG